MLFLRENEPNRSRYTKFYRDKAAKLVRTNCYTVCNFKYCPISFRTVDSIDYKKALLLFYEVNNITALKKIFIAQYAFAVNTYF
jgi:hypothetical protein